MQRAGASRVRVYHGGLVRGQAVSGSGYCWPWLAVVGVIALVTFLCGNWHRDFHVRVHLMGGISVLKTIPLGAPGVAWWGGQTENGSTAEVCPGVWWTAPVSRNVGMTLRTWGCALCPQTKIPAG